MVSRPKSLGRNAPVASCAPTPRPPRLPAPPRSPEPGLQQRHTRTAQVAKGDGSSADRQHHRRTRTVDRFAFAPGSAGVLVVKRDTAQPPVREEAELRWAGQ